MKPTTIFLTRELTDLLRDTRVPISTTVKAVDADGNVKKTSSGNIVYVKYDISLSAILYLTSQGLNNEELYVYDYATGEYTKPPPIKIGNAFSMRKKGTFVPSSKDVDVDDIWKLDNRVEIPRWSRIIKGIIDATYKYSIDKSLKSTTDKLPTKAVIVEKVLEEITKFYTAELTITITKKTSDIYTVDYFDDNCLGSCMSYFNREYYGTRQNVFIYDRIDEVQGALFSDKNGTNLGRTLLWGGKYHDVIYAYGHTEKLKIQKALAIGGYEKLQKKHKFTVEAPSDDVNDYPYMDTMCYLSKDGDYMQMYDEDDYDKNGVCLQQCNLEGDEEMIWCEVDAQMIDSDDARYIEDYGYAHYDYVVDTRNGYVLEDNARYLEHLDTYEHYDDCVSSAINDEYYSDRYTTYSETEGGHILADEAVYCEINEEDIHVDNAVQVTDADSQYFEKYIHVDELDEALKEEVEEREAELEETK